MSPATPCGSFPERQSIAQVTGLSLSLFSQSFLIVFLNAPCLQNKANGAAESRGLVLLRTNGVIGIWGRSAFWICCHLLPTVTLFSRMETTLFQSFCYKNAEGQ